MYQRFQKNNPIIIKKQNVNQIISIIFNYDVLTLWMAIIYFYRDNIDNTYHK